MNWKAGVIMMNKKYMNYLIRNRKIALIFFFVIYLAMSLTPYIHGFSRTGEELFNGSLMIATVMSVMLCFALPVLQFAYIQRKKSADLFLALPVSRKEQLNTNLLFCFGTAFGYFLVTTLLILVLTGAADFGKYLCIAAHNALLFAVIILLNTLFFLIANNVFDGIVMIASYAFLPTFLYLAYLFFMTNTVAGYTEIRAYSSGIMMTSPLYMGFRNLNGLMQETEMAFHWLYEILLAVYGALAYACLQFHFVKRKAERAEQISNEFFAYPFIIHIYMACVMIFLMERNGIRDVLVFYILLFVIYIIATFVYKRKIQLDWKNVLIYACAMGLSILLAKVSWSTKGFGLARLNPVRTNDKIYYQYLVIADPNDLSKMYDYDSGGNDSVEVTFLMEIPKGKSSEYKEEMDALEQYRLRAVDSFYTDDGQYNGDGGASFSVSNYQSSEIEKISFPYYNRYYSVALLTEDELTQISRKADVKVITHDEEWNETTMSLEDYLEMRKS